MSAFPPIDTESHGSTVRTASAPSSPAQDGSELGNLREMPPWAISTLVHLALLFVLWRVVVYSPTDVDPPIESALVEEEILPEHFKFEATIQDQIGSQSDLNTLSASQLAATQAGENPQKELDRLIEQELLPPTMPITHRVVQPHQAEFIETYDATGATEHAGGVDGAIDRLTYEIAASLKERKTLAIWMFDASLSLNDRRAAIADRFENVYRQLDHLNVGADTALKTAVVSFGSQTHVMTEDPVDDVGEIVEAVRNIKPDETGKENVFAAVGLVARKWERYRTDLHRNVMLIIVTDERGDDFVGLEPTVQYLRRLGMRCYVVGNAAPFGREKGEVLYRYEDGFTEYLPVDAGPESIRMERLRLGFWGGSGRDLEKMSSGFGPYALTRLCAETGGLYLITDESVRGPKFDPAIMRTYAPDYMPIREYDKALAENKGKAVLVQAAAATQAEDVVAPQLNFRADNDNVLRQDITEAQKPAAIFDFKLQQMASLLEAGEKDREKIASPRWRAAYDLAMGRVLAMRVRAYGYNVVLADMKSTPKSFEKPGSNRWRLVPSREIAGGPTVKKLAAKAKEYLTRVVDEHPGTPWELLAARELSQEMGWTWEEYKVAPPAQRNGNNNDGPRLQLVEPEKKKQQMNKQPQKTRVRPSL